MIRLRYAVFRFREYPRITISAEGVSTLDLREDERIAFVADGDRLFLERRCDGTGSQVWLHATGVRSKQRVMHGADMVAAGAKPGRYGLVPQPCGDRFLLVPE